MSTSRLTRTDAIETVQRLLALHPEISELVVFQPNHSPPAQQRLGSVAGIQAVFEAGLKLREQLSLPFWDSVLLSCCAVGADVVPILEQALFHNSPPKREFTVSSTNWSRESLHVEIQRLGAGDMLVLSSRVRLANGSDRHIPMLDFHCPASARGDELVVQTAKLIYPAGGYVLRSGQSYHFYGKSLLSETGLFRFLARALLLSPITDRAWIAHQLIEGACGLRVSGHPDGGTLPQLLAEFG